MKITIAVVQFEILYRKPAENFAKVALFLQKAKDAGAQIIIFPELFLTGPLGRGDKLIDDKAIHRKHLQELSRTYKIDIVTGSLIEKDAKGVHNTTYYIDAKGTIRGKYHKINLWHTERKRMIPGTRVSVFSTSFGKVGLCICWDMVFPEMFSKMVRKGVQLVFCPSYWCTQITGEEVKHDLSAETKHVDALCTARAFENELVFIYCNAAGRSAEVYEEFPKKLIGHSQITVPFKGALECFRHNKEGMFIQVVDTDILKDAENLYKIRESNDQK